jgi:hypothetical protein
MYIPIKRKAFYENWDSFRRDYPMVDAHISPSIFESRGKDLINEMLNELMPNEFWMITSARKGAYMVYILDKEKVLDAIGLNVIMEHFS